MLNPFHFDSVLMKLPNLTICIKSLLISSPSDLSNTEDPTNIIGNLALVNQVYTLAILEQNGCLPSRISINTLVVFPKCSYS